MERLSSSLYSPLLWIVLSAIAFVVAGAFVHPALAFVALGLAFAYGAYLTIINAEEDEPPTEREEDDE